MIFKHRQNDSSLWNEDTAVELDVRLSGRDRVVLSHDPIKYKIELDFSANVNTLLYNDLDFPKETIVNVKTSGAEEIVTNEFNTIMYDDYYFLDSQIPDMLRLSKLPEYEGKFIVRVSDVESWNQEFIDRIKPKYIWADWSQFGDFDADIYGQFINTLTRQIGDDQELIIVSPELYNPDYEYLIPTIGEIITRHGHSSVCTKKETQWEALIAKSK